MFFLVWRFLDGNLYGSLRVIVLLSNIAWKSRILV